MRVEANGLGFHVVDEGDGPPVLLLHGFPDTSELWRSQIEALGGAGYRVVAPDLRGRGRSDRPAEVGAYGLSSIVGDVVGIMDALELPRAHVVGHDWGAAVAWLTASLAPQRVDHLAVISVGFPGAVRPDLEALQKGWYRLLVLSEHAEALFPQDDWYLLRELLHGGGDVDAYIATLSEPGALTAGFNWYRANVAVETLLGTGRELPPVPAPTLGVFGTNDLYLAERAMLASESHVTGEWRYERLEGVGHWVPLEAAERLNELLLDFFPSP